MEQSSPKHRTRRNSKSLSEQQQQENVATTSSGGIDDDDVLILEEEGLTNTHDRLPFADGQWDVAKYCERIVLQMVNQSEDGLELEFDLINVEAPIANDLRRILIAEVPTMAIEKVYLYQNTSCIQDEVFCHRLGLLPIYADARKFAFPPPAHSTADQQQQQQQLNTDYLEEEPPGKPDQNLVVELHVVCPSEKGRKKRGSAAKMAGGSAPGSDGEENAGGASASCVKEPNDSGNWVVYSSAFKWIPIGQQREQFREDLPRLVHDDIILAKLRPGQEIEARCHCVKGIGRDHAKFSPVATATYRLLPQIRLKRNDFDDDQAERLQSSFSSGVIGRREQTGRVYVKDARADTSSRNVFMHDDLKDAVEMGKKKTHFIFSVESTGAFPAHELVVEACKVMRAKVDNLREQIKLKLDIL